MESKKIRRDRGAVIVIGPPSASLESGLVMLCQLKRTPMVSPSKESKAKQHGWHWWAANPIIVLAGFT